MIANLSFILLQHWFILTRSLISAQHAFCLFVCVFSIIFSLGCMTLRPTLLLIVFLLFFHLHVHQDFNARLYVLEDCEWVCLTQSLALFRQYILIISVNLNKRFQSQLLAASSIHFLIIGKWMTTSIVFNESLIFQSHITTYFFIRPDLNRQVQINESFF